MFRLMSRRTEEAEALRFELADAKEALRDRTEEVRATRRLAILAIVTAASAPAEATETLRRSLGTDDLLGWVRDHASWDRPMDMLTYRRRLRGDRGSITWGDGEGSGE